MHGPGQRPETMEAALAACARGDAAALRWIYDAEAGRMIGVAMRILKRRPLAEDAVHDAFTQIWRAAATFDPARGQGRTWIYAVLRNRALGMLRAEGRLALTDAPLADDVPTGEDDPEVVMARLSENDALHRCLATLAPDRRSAILLAYMHGLSHRDLAARLGQPLGTVKAWIRRSLMALRECLS